MSKFDYFGGLLVIEVINSNPNGDPDEDNAPRRGDDNHGIISAVSVKRKIRDTIHCKEAPAWQEIKANLPDIDENRYQIYEVSGRKMGQIKAADLQNEYCDARWFGTMDLQKADEKEKGENKKSDHMEYVRTGGIVLGLGTSIAPVEVVELTNTRSRSSSEETERMMGNKCYKVVPYGIYYMPYFVQPTAWFRNACNEEDIRVFQSVIPYIYSCTASAIRPNVNLLHAWHLTYDGVRCNHYWDIIKSLAPRANDPSVPMSDRSGCTIPSMQSLPESLTGSLKNIKDLVSGESKDIVV